MEPSDAFAYPRPLMPIPVIDLFAGPGGLNEGFNQVRDARGNRIFQTRVSVEYEELAHRTLELRALFRRLEDHGEKAPYYEYARGKITRDVLFSATGEHGKLASREALHATLGKSVADNAAIEDHIAAELPGATKDGFVLIGGPPCQAYSLVGRARRTRETRAKFESDHKHVLYREYLRIVSRFRPAAFLMENVPGLLSASLSGAATFDLIRHDLGAMELMRHSDMKLTMGVYTDVTQLPIIQETARLPSFQIGNTEAKRAHLSAPVYTQGSTQTGVVLGLLESSPVSTRPSPQLPQFSATDAARHEKTPGVASGRFGKMEREKRLELSTSTLARWCSTN